MKLRRAFQLRSRLRLLRPVLEARVFLDERQRHVAGGAIALLGDVSVVLPAARLQRERAGKARKQTNLAEFSGTLRLAEDPLAWQQRLRAEWA